MSILSFDAKRKTAASKQRVADMVSAHVTELNRAAKVREEQEETERIRRMCLLELGLAYQKMYTLLGLEETDTLGPWCQSAKREEYKMKQKIKGVE